MVCKFDACFSFMSFNLEKDSIRARLAGGRRETRSEFRARPLTNFNQSFSTKSPKPARLSRREFSLYERFA